MICGFVRTPMKLAIVQATNLCFCCTRIPTNSIRPLPPLARWWSPENVLTLTKFRVDCFCLSSIFALYSYDEISLLFHTNTCTSTDKYLQYYDLH
jgi:hypothetical protein